MAVNRDIKVIYSPVNESENQEWTLKYVDPKADTTEVANAILNIWETSTSTLVDIYAVDTYSIKPEAVQDNNHMDDGGAPGSGDPPIMTDG